MGVGDDAALRLSGAVQQNGEVTTRRGLPQPVNHDPGWVQNGAGSWRRGPKRKSLGIRWFSPRNARPFNAFSLAI
jgi:hypothetical protein